MSKRGHRISKEIKDQILGRIKNDGVSVAQASEEHGVSTKTIYSWLTKGVSEQPSWSEVAKLKKENAQLKQLLGELTVQMSMAQKSIESRE
jgi:transposase-like protein